MEADLRVAALRVRAPARAGPALRPNLERLLSSADLRPPGMPPQAVLIVRHMRDPQPGCLAGGLRAARVQAGWERAVREQLAALQRRAARPALGPVPPDAEAVLFADESELLACLARDTGQGRVGQRWWWRALLRSGWGGSAPVAGEAYSAALVRQLVRRAHMVPAVLARLADWDEAVPVLRVLSPAQAIGVLEGMLLAYGLPVYGLPPYDLPAYGFPGSGRIVHSPIANSLPEPPGNGSGAVGVQPAPWVPAGRGAGTLTSSLGCERDALLGVALDLAARPERVASVAYQRRFQAWWMVAGRGGSAKPVVTSRGESSGTAGLLAAEGAESRREKGLDAGADAGASAQDLAVGNASTRAGNEVDPGLRELSQERLAGAGDVAGDGAREPEGSSGKKGGTRREAEGDTSHEVRAPEGFGQIGVEGEPGFGLRGAGQRADPDQGVDLTGLAVAGELPASTLSWLENGVPTRLGGVLYLINLMVALDLPSCFEAGWRLASGVGPWGLLHALGWELLRGGAAAGEAGYVDPLWRALTHLDGRPPGQSPGAWLPRSRPRRWSPFELPAAWVEGIPDSSVLPATLSVDLHRSRQAAALRTRYPPLLARWLALALPFIDLRLRLALGLSEAEELAGALLRLPGQLYVTRMHVDLVVSLEHVSLPVRRAGLDRDPGWLPDFGRVVYFHFA